MKQDNIPKLLENLYVQESCIYKKTHNRSRTEKIHDGLAQIITKYKFLQNSIVQKI